MREFYIRKLYLVLVLCKLRIIIHKFGSSKLETLEDKISHYNH